MTRHTQTRAPTHARSRWGPATVVMAMLALVLAGCAQSSNTTSTALSVPGAGSPPASTPATPTTATTTTGSGTAGTPGGVPGLSVTPAVGSPDSVMHFAVTPSYRAGAQGSEDISIALSVMGPQKAGCVGVHEQGLSALPPGQTTDVSLGPAQLGGTWCPGTYNARVEILERPKCGQGMMCPQFIRVLAAIGPVSFRISS